MNNVTGSDDRKAAILYCNVHWDGEISLNNYPYYSEDDSISNPRTFKYVVSFPIPAEVESYAMKLKNKKKLQGVIETNN